MEIQQDFFLLNVPLVSLDGRKIFEAQKLGPYWDIARMGWRDGSAIKSRLTTKNVRYCQKPEPLSASLQVYYGAWLSFPGHSVLVGWIHGTVWPCISFGNMKPGVSVSYHVLLGDDIAHIRHTVIVYLWFQRVSDVRQGASDAAILGWSESSGRAGSHPVDFVFPRLPCGSQWGYFLGMPLLLGLRTCFVEEFPPSATRLFYHTFTSDRRYSNHSGERCGWRAPVLYWNEVISRPRCIFNLTEKLMFWKQSSLRWFIFPFTICSKW